MQYMPDDLKPEPLAALTETHFVGLPAAPAFEMAAREQGERLRRRAPDVRSCSVTLRAMRRQDATCRYSVTVDAHLPGDEFTTCRLDGSDARVALARAFEALFLQINERSPN